MAEQSELDQHHEEQADNKRKEGNTLNQSSGDNHKAADVASGFGLSGRPVHRRASEPANSNTSPNGRNSGTETCSEISESSGIHDERFLMK